MDSSSHQSSSSAPSAAASFVRHSGNPFIENEGSAGSSPFGSSSSCPSTPTVVVNNGEGGNLQQQQSSAAAALEHRPPMPPYRIRRMRPEDVPAVLDIWAANDLHEGLHTIQSFMAVDRDGFVVAVEVEEEDEEEGKEAAKDEAPKEGGDQEAAAAADTTSKEVATTVEEVTTTTTSKPSSVGGKLMSGLLNRKQICCCAVQAPNSPPPPPEETSLETQQQQQQQRQQKVTFRTSRSADNEETALVCRRREKRVLGMCAAVFVHPQAPAGFIGLYGVRPELHGRGIGQAMWRRVMEHVAGRNAALYAVPQHLTMYRDRAGFRHPDDRLLLIYESCSEVMVEPRVDLLVDGIRGVEVVTMAGQGSTAEEKGHPLQGIFQEINTEVLLEQVARFDAAVHGYPRRALLEKVLFEGESAALVALDLEEADDRAGTAYSVLGYGCLRTNNIGKAMLGPLYADNDAVAELLMRRLFSALPGPFSRGLLYMSLDSNPGGERIADKLGLVQHEQLPRFFTGAPYREGAKWEAVYCIHSPNFSLL